MEEKDAVVALQQKARDNFTKHEELIDEISNMAEGLDNQIATHFNQKADAVDAILEILINQLRVTTTKSNKPLHALESRVFMCRTIVDAISKTNRKPKTAASSISKISQIVSVSAVLNEKIFASNFFYQPIELIDFSLDYSISRTVYSGLHPLYRNVTDISKPTKTVKEWPEKQEKLNKPWGLAVHPITGNIYAVSRGNAHVFVLTPELDFLFKFGSPGSGPGQLSYPQGIAISLDGKRVAVVDYGHDRAQIFDDQGNFVGSAGKSGREGSDLSCPYHATFDIDGYFYVSDINNDRVQKYDQDGKHMLAFAKRGTDGDVGIPYGVSYQSDGTILVIGHGQSYVKRFDTNGKFLARYNIERPKDDNDVFRGPNGGFGVCFKSENKIKFYDKEGKKIHMIDAHVPRGVVFGLDNRLYVSLNDSDTIAIY